MTSILKKKLGQMVGDEYLLGLSPKKWKTNLTLLAGIVIALAALLAIVNYCNDSYLDFWGCVVTIIVCAVSLILLRLLRSHEWALYLLSVYMFFFAAFLLLFGDSTMYAALWVLAYPLGASFFLGNDFTRPYLTLMTASILVIFSPMFDAWRTASYSTSFRLQFPVIFVVFSVMAMIAEGIRERTSQKLLDMAKHFFATANQDELTGLFNRRAFYDVIEREMSRDRRHQCGLQLIICDIDHFKVINDRHGHQCGDRFLVHVSHLLKDQLRSEDYCFRWGGEEFLLLLPNTSTSGALYVAERLRYSIEHSPLKDEKGGCIVTTMSFGVHKFNTEFSVDENIAQTDECLYRAKQNGRNRVEQSMATMAEKKEGPPGTCQRGLAQSDK